MRKKLLFLMLVLMMLVAACAGPAAEAPAGDSPETDEEIAADSADDSTDAAGEEEAAPAEEEEPVEPEPMEMQDVAIGAGTFVLNVTYPYLNMPRTEQLGYWEDMGYDVMVDAVGSSTDALQQLIGGNYDFVWIGGTVVLQGAAQEGLDLRVVHQSDVIDWSLAVPADSGIESPADMVGKKIGVYSLGSSGIPLLSALLSGYDVNMEEDVELIPVGFGPQASQALTAGDVDGVMLWGAAIAQLENLGHELTLFKDDTWSQMTDVVLATTQSVIDENPQMVADIVRGMNMGAAFAVANPECTIQLQWANWPDTKPADMDEAAAMAWDMKLLESKIEFAMVPGTYMYGEDAMGKQGPEELGLLQEFLLEQELLTAEIDPSQVIIADETFWDQVNDFDLAGVQAEAEACDFDF